MVVMKAMTLRLPGPMHEDLRRRSFETRVPMNALVRRAVHLMLTSDPAKVEAWLKLHPEPADPEDAQ